MDNKKNIDSIKFESDVKIMKYKVLKEVAVLGLQGKLEENFHELPKRIIPGPKALIRCCIYHEREVVKQRVKLAMGGNSKKNNVIEVLEAACDACPIQRYVVTEACRGCLAHRCQEACHFGAISIIEHKAFINADLCKECGKCKDACLYNAISDVRRPCITSCNAGALSIDEDKKAVIDDDKCVQCGSCVNVCPFGAIMDKSYILDAINIIKEKENNSKLSVYAIVAPAVATQFPFASMGQVVSAIKKIGFDYVMEAALGADIVTEHEANEFVETIKEKNLMTSSCCPAFVSFIKKNYPQFEQNIATSVSPMAATGRLIKQIDKNSKVIFIGPCTAKKMEARKEESIDCVITFEELLALLDAENILISECEESQYDSGSYFGRIFARSGGLTSAVEEFIKEENIDVEYKPVICNGLKECDTALKLAKFNKSKGNFIEGMACKGGCIGGSCSLQHTSKDLKHVEEYGKLSKEIKINDSFKEYDIENLDLHKLHK